MTDNDLIYKRTARRIIDSPRSREQMLAVLEGTPPIVEIIRCRDCISYKEGIDINGKPFTRCNGSVRTYGHTPPDWYCADAKRRTDEPDE